MESWRRNVRRACWTASGDRPSPPAGSASAERTSCSPNGPTPARARRSGRSRRCTCTTATTRPGTCSRARSASSAATSGSRRLPARPCSCRAASSHTFWNAGAGAARYVIVMTPRIAALIEALHEPGALDDVPGALRALRLGARLNRRARRGNPQDFPRSHSQRARFSTPLPSCRDTSDRSRFALAPSTERE